MPDLVSVETKFLRNLWDDTEAARLSPLEELRYRSNRLGDDLRITNFGGGNTSSKFDLPDPLTGEPTRVLAVKGSGGDLRSITASGFAILYMDKLEALIRRYRGEAFEAVARFSALRSRRSPASRLGNRARSQRQRHTEDGGVQSAVRPHSRVGPLAATGIRAGTDAAPRRGGESRLRWDHSWWPRPVHVGPDARGVLSQ